VNDPAGIALMIGMIEVATSDHASLLAVGREFGVEMVVGAAIGIAGGRAIVVMLRRLRLPSEAMYPVLALMLGGVLYGAASLAHGSGFLAVFLAGLLLGDARVPYKGEIERFQASLASFAELAVFVGLGLTIELAALGTRAWLEGAALALVLALVVRPLVVFATLHRADLTRAERTFISWSGLKGAVPILLAAFAVLAGADGAQRLYGLVFVVVLFSVVGQGTLVPYVARRLGIPMRVRDRTPWDISIGLEGEPGAQEYEVGARSAADGAEIQDLPLGDDAWVTLVVRDGAALEPDASLSLRAGDRLLVLCDADRSHALTAVFRRAGRAGA
jgi:cell volume regulation protein A